MTRREEWKIVLDAEVEWLSAMPWEDLVSAMPESKRPRRDFDFKWFRFSANAAPEPMNYVVEFNSKRFQVELNLLENTSEYIHVGIGVDDGHLPEAIHPASTSFILRKALPSE